MLRSCDFLLAPNSPERAACAEECKQVCRMDLRWVEAMSLGLTLIKKEEASPTPEGVSPESRLTPEERRELKRIRFGLLYGSRKLP